MTARTRMKRKDVDDVLGGDDHWKHADSTAGSAHCLLLCAKFFAHEPLVATCDKCEHGRAYFYQLQIRSADEPMTTCEYPIHYVVRRCLSSENTLVLPDSLPVSERCACTPIQNSHSLLAAPAVGINGERTEARSRLGPFLNDYDGISCYSI